MRSDACARWASSRSYRILVLAAVILLTLAVAFGTGLGLWHLRATDTVPRPPGWAGIVHGLVGIVGLAILLLALRGPERGVAQGAGSFGKMAAGFFAVALLAAIAFLIRRRQGSAVLLAIHAGLAITGYVMLLAWDYVG